VGERREWTSPTIFLASGKHDVRGERRPRQANDPALGLRIRVPPSPNLETRVGDAIELHLFEGGYAGIVLQEDGSANICLALRKSLLAESGGDPWSLLNNLAANHPHFAQRLDNASRDLPIDTIGSVPYGWIAQNTQAGLYRLGDQAAVIPSLAGEGMAIAVTSARVAVEAFLSGETAPRYQTRFGARARKPVAAAKLFWTMSETTSGALMMTRLTNYLPGIARLAMRLSRI
jgi:flavin-dependent dehydrogenase